MSGILYGQNLDVISEQLIPAGIIGCTATGIRKAEQSKFWMFRAVATVQNPFIFCAKDVVDPEQLNVSINTSDAMTRNVIFGINLSFK